MPRISAKEAAAQGLRYVNGEWVGPDGDRWGTLPQTDPSSVVVNGGWKERLGKAGMAAGAVVGAPLLAGALGAGAGAGASAAAPAAGSAGAGAAGGGGGFLSALSKLAPMAQNAASVLGGAAGGSADTAAARSAFDLSRYGLEQNAQFNQGQLDLSRKQFDESSEASRMKRALVGQLLGNLQDVNVSVPGITNATISGGLRPSALGSGGVDIAKLMSQRAVDQATAGNSYQGGQMVPRPEFSGGGNGFLNTAATIASLLGMPRSTGQASMPRPITQGGGFAPGGPYA